MGKKKTNRREKRLSSQKIPDGGMILLGEGPHVRERTKTRKTEGVKSSKKGGGGVTEYNWRVLRTGRGGQERGCGDEAIGLGTHRVEKKNMK